MTALFRNEDYMQRCVQLATLGQGRVAPNPMVGSVLVYENRIIGEGYHQKFGEAHAEVNCIRSVSNQDRDLIQHSTLYVSLEPCNHFGKTPPCVDLILENKITKVVIGVQDSFSKVNGQGIAWLRENGVEVTVGVMGEECRKLNKRFFTFHTLTRPFVLLKWAESSDGFIAGNETANLRLSNSVTDRLVHKWRSQESSIMIGRKTATLDNPSLTTRLWPGQNPIRIVLDPNLQTEAGLKIYNGEVRTIVFHLSSSTHLQKSPKENVEYISLQSGEDLPLQICNHLHREGIQSVMIEGGQMLLQTFINAGMWDEARIIRNTEIFLFSGVRAPSLMQAQVITIETVGNNTITTLAPR